MEGFYEVLYNNEPAGKVQVMRQGLYYRFHCRAQIRDSRVCRLIAQWMNGWENLGILVPEGNGFVLDRKLPVKRIGTPPAIFRLIPSGEDIESCLSQKNTAQDQGSSPNLSGEPGQGDEAGLPDSEYRDDQLQDHREEDQDAVPESEDDDALFYPLNSEEPISVLEELEEAAFALRDEQPGILIPVISENETAQEDASAE